MLVDDWMLTQEYRDEQEKIQREKEKRIELYSRRYDMGLAIFTGQPLPPGESEELEE